MKLTTTTQVSVDGVMQGNGGLHVEDRRLASDMLREVLLALGDDEPPRREDRTSP